MSNPSVLRRADILGAWVLVSWTAEVDGGVSTPLGPDPVGSIIYTPDGYMSAQLMRRDRPAYRRADIDGGTTEQTVAAASGYLAYSGPYTLDESTGAVYHHVGVSLLPNWLGGTQVRQGHSTAPLSCSAPTRRHARAGRHAPLWCGGDPADESLPVSPSSAASPGVVTNCVGVRPAPTDRRASP
jgi:hypothetical protein